jgi:energy-coupling factor transporter ATP-binding protein EcfA2
MQNFKLTLASPVATSFRATKAANSLDIDSEKKSVHHFEVQADLTTPFNIGLIVGASGSGKTTLAKHIYGDECFKEILDMTQPVIDQFPESMSYDECAAMLCGVGLTAVPCWIRPAYTLSNGQRARAECALQMARDDIAMIVIDEWTSVVDRTVAKVMSHCIQKHARKTGKKIVLMSCHYDVIEWLNPDWVIDANKQTYENRRSLWRDYKRTEQLQFQIYETDRSTWKYFSRYHYLSDSYPGGLTKTYGMFVDGNQIGFQCFANYVPHRKGTKMILHSNRVVIHPDYCGFGLGLRMTDACAEKLKNEGYEIFAKFSSVPMYNARKKSDKWKLMDVMRHHKIVVGGNMKRKDGFRKDVKTWSFKYL